MLKDLKTYNAWQHMKDRCNNPANSKAAYYYQLDITYDPAWESYVVFQTDMGIAPPGFWLDRKNNSLGYSKDNCRWATPTEQNNNRGMFQNNKTGIAGVSFKASHRNWIATGRAEGKQKTLYQGKDFFEACCARKSFEVYKCATL